jgi:hypothetical protein
MAHLHIPKQPAHLCRAPGGFRPCRPLIMMQTLFVVRYEQILRYPYDLAAASSLCLADICILEKQWTSLFCSCLISPRARSSSSFSSVVFWPRAMAASIDRCVVLFGVSTSKRSLGEWIAPALIMLTGQAAAVLEQESAAPVLHRFLEMYCPPQLPHRSTESAPLLRLEAACPRA